ncbi:MAG: metallophosphatase family protein [Defluviitaleaceae bacterium]|nr:metallophosphatase family protein [Defluviitaleaceae bacterium]
MKIGIITDIHNNILALESVLKVFNDENCDGVICCGDIIGIGPHPEETVLAVMNIPNLLTCVRGNHERYLIEGLDAHPYMDAGEAEHHKWQHALLSDKSVNFIKSLQDEVILDMGGKRVHVCHYGMGKNGWYARIIHNPTISDLSTLFAGIDADVVLFGHHHIKTIDNSDKFYINCGSLGCPHSGDKNTASAGILTIEDDISFVELEVEYDVNEVLCDIERLSYPEKDTIIRIFFGR